VSTRVTSARLVGRTSELAELEAALADAAAGRPTLAVVAGESGVGKTRLLSELVARARADGARALTGECVELGEGELPYAPLIAALRPIARAGDPALDGLPAAMRAELGRLVPTLAEGATPPPGPAADSHDPAAQGHLFEALLTLLDRLGQAAPLLLVLEDVHWADRSTRAFLAFLARSLCDERVLAVVSYRPDELHRRHPLRPLLAELERGVGGRVSRIVLSPLSREELAEALGGILGAPPDAELVERLHARSEGNPLFMEELLAAGLDGRGGPPPTLRDALMVRVDRMGEDAQDVVRLLAAARRLDHELLAEASGLQARALRDALREAVAAHVVVVDGCGRHAFRHALLREVVDDDLLPGERAELHRALAAALERRAQAQPADAQLLAALAHHHLAAGDQRAALAASVRAAAAAERVPAPGEASALLERALELWHAVPDPEAVAGADRVDLLRRAADVSAAARAEALLRTALDEVDEAAAPRRAADLLRRLARARWALNRSDEAIASARAGLALVEDDESSPERARLLSWLAKARMLQGRYGEAVEAARVAEEAARATGDGRALSHALNARGFSLMALGEVDEGAAVLRRAAEEAPRRGARDEALAAYTNLADGLHQAGRTEEAMAVTREGLELARELPGEREWLMLELGELAFDAGDWRTAEETLPGRDRRFEGRRLLFVELRRAQLALGRGDHATAAERLALVEPLLGSSSEPQFTAPLGALGAELRRRQGDLAGARAIVDEALDRIEFCTEDVRMVALVAAAGVAVEADRAERARDLGDDAEASAALERMEELMLRVRALDEDAGPVEQALRATAEADAARGAGEHDAARWAQAARAWEAVARPYPAALARLGEAEAHLAHDARDEAAEAARAAHATAAGLGAGWLRAEVEGLAARARLRLEPDAGRATEDAPAAAPPAEDPFGLTPRERQVLALVAQGATNREIGAELFMAEKTASVHVSRILAKLDVRSRTQAAAVAHRLGLEELARSG
jgi:DNA-binding NarL/FixJ family response regulator